MTLYDQINQAHDVETFKLAAEGVRQAIYSGQHQEHVQPLMMLLAIRGHVLMAGALGRDRWAGPLISNQVMLTLQAEPGGE